MASDGNDLESATETGGGISRRKVLAGAAATGGALWAAPSITGIAAAAAASPACTCAGRGTALRFTGPLADLATLASGRSSFGTSDGGESCEITGPGTEVSAALSALGVEGEGTLLCGSFSSAECTAQSRIEGANGAFSFPNGDVLEFQDVAVAVRATVDCDCNVTREIVTLSGSVGGNPLTVPGPNETIVLSSSDLGVSEPSISLVINELDCDGDSHVIRALHLYSPFGDVIVGEALAGNDNPACACNPT